jgi:hypothetical protein
MLMMRIGKGLVNLGYNFLDQLETDCNRMPVVIALVLPRREAVGRKARRPRMTKMRRSLRRSLRKKPSMLAPSSLLYIFTNTLC